MKKFILISFFILQTITVFSQQSVATSEMKNKIGELKRDTLYAKRVFLWTSIYKNTFRMSGSSAWKAMNINSEAKTKYVWGRIIQPIGPIVAIGGIALAANGLSGKTVNVVIDNVPYTYIDRSLTKTLGGLGLLALGICIIESSNELIQHSVDIYNNSVLNRKRKMTYQWGITPEGNLGIAMNF